jgi:hypothetical protein
VENLRGSRRCGFRHNWKNSSNFSRLWRARNRVSGALHVSERVHSTPRLRCFNRDVQRSYLFKDSGYRAEQEVRFVLKVDPRFTNESRGVLVSLNTKSLVDTQKAWPFVRASPFLPLEEQFSIESLARKRLFPRLSSDRPTGTSRSPFIAESNLPAGLFTDLDSPYNP